MLDQLSRRAARARRRARRVADRVEDLRPAEHRGVAREVPRNARDLLRRLPEPDAQLQRQALPRTATSSSTTEPCRSRIRRSGSRARTASRSSSPRATATTPRCSSSSPTASRSSTSTARSGSSTRTTRAGTTRMSRAPFLAKTQHMVIAETRGGSAAPGRRGVRRRGRATSTTSRASSAGPTRTRPSLRARLGAAPDRRHPAHRAEKVQAMLDVDDRELPALHLLLRRSRAGARACARSSSSSAK